MIARANSVWSILRGTDVNDDGDEVDNLTVAASGVPGFLAQTRLNTKTESSETPQTEITYCLRYPRYADIRSGDLLGNEADGSIYIVDTVTRPPAGSINHDLKVTARHIQDSTPSFWPAGSVYNPFVDYFVKRVDGPTDSVLVEHEIGFPHHTTVFVEGEQVLADITPSEDWTETLVEFEDLVVDVVIVCSV